MTQTQKTHFADDDTLAHISDIEEENNRLLMANRDCVGHFNELLRDYNELKEQLAGPEKILAGWYDLDYEVSWGKTKPTITGTWKPLYIERALQEDKK